MKIEKVLSSVSDEEVLEFYRQVSKSIKKIRKEKKISQLDLALDIGIKSVEFYSNCENNRYDKHFNLEHIFKISKILDIDICKLLKNSDDSM